MGIYNALHIECEEHKIELHESFCYQKTLSNLLNLISDLPGFVALYPSLKGKLMTLVVSSLCTLESPPVSSVSRYDIIDDIDDIEDIKKQTEIISISRKIESRARFIIHTCPNHSTPLDTKLERFEKMKQAIEEIQKMAKPDILSKILSCQDD